MNRMNAENNKEEPCSFNTNETLPTEVMLNQLKNTSGLDDFITENKKGFYNSSICEHFEMLFDKYGISKSDAIKRSNIESGYAYQILRGIKNAKRDKYIRLAVGIGLNLEDTQRLLTIARQGILYPKVLRDALIIFAINNRLGIVNLELLMEEKGVELLD
jgi:hypothetical protein